jgi:signal transduction histidine kinase
MSQPPGVALTTVLELVRWLDAGLAASGAALVVKDERGETLFVGCALSDAFEPGSSLGLRERLGWDEARVLSGQSVECVHEAGGVRRHCRQTVLQLTCGARLIVGLISEAPLLDPEPRSQLRLLYEAREDERRKLATQMHDTLAQTLTSLSMHAEVLSGVIEHGIEEARLMLQRLRPPELGGGGLEPALRALLAKTRVEGRLLSDRNPSEHPVREPHALGLYRMVEVLLEPALKADPAWYVQLTITPSGQDELQLEAHVVSEHLVLDSTRLQAVAEPVDAVGGRVQIVSHDGAHALLRGIVPRAASEPQR